ncbi:MAG TPA: PspC domain-containing protein [Acidimicrobiia bacterium]
MTEPPTGPEAGAGPTEPMPPRARLTRSRTDRVIGGVAGGLGKYFGVDPVWFRLGFVVFTLAGGSGILAYLIAWIVIPEETGEETAATAPAKPLGPQGSMIAGMALVAIGLVLLIRQFVPWFSQLMWPAAIVVAGAALIVMGLRHDRS